MFLGHLVPWQPPGDAPSAVSVGSLCPKERLLPESPSASLPGSLAQDRNLQLTVGSSPGKGGCTACSKPPTGEGRWCRGRAQTWGQSTVSSMQRMPARSPCACPVKQPSVWWPVPDVFQIWCCHTHLTVAEEAALRKFITGLHCSSTVSLRADTDF